MKREYLIIPILVLMFIGISCNKKNGTKHYEIMEHYDTGELLLTIERLNEYEGYTSFYFKNGQISQEGKIVYGNLKDGNWKTYYTDGVLRGEMIFSKDTFIREIIKYPIKLDFENNPTEFKVDNLYQFRILGVSFCEILVPVKIFGHHRSLDTTIEPYSFEIKPRKPGTDTISVIIFDYSNKKLGNDTIFFPITIVE